MNSDRRQNKNVYNKKIKKNRTHSRFTYLHKKIVNKYLRLALEGCVCVQRHRPVVRPKQRGYPG